MSRVFNNYIIGPFLGAGTFSTVEVGTEQSTGKKVALKVISKKDQTEADVEVVRQEVELMMELSQLDNPNLVELYECVWDADYPLRSGKMSRSTVLLMELITGGELFPFIAETGKLDETLARTYFHQLLNGLSAMHNERIAHRDIKPENLLLDRNFTLKIADFGCAQEMQDSDNDLYTSVGTERYQAPEIYKNQGYDGTLADIWSAGVCLFVMVSAVPPYTSPHALQCTYFHLLATDIEQFWNQHSQYNHFSQSFKEMMSGILEVNPDDRWTIEEIRQCDWFNEGILSPDQLREDMGARRRQIKLPQGLPETALFETQDVMRGNALPLQMADFSGRIRNESSDLKEQVFNFKMNNSSFGEAKAAAISPPVIDDTIAVYTSFRSNYRASVMWDTLEYLFSYASGCVIDTKEFCMTGNVTVPNTSRRVKLSAYLFSQSEANPNSGVVVQIKKDHRADTFDFLLAYKDLWNVCSPLIACDNEVRESDSKRQE
jgi:serine/threonine protein kinase